MKKKILKFIIDVEKKTTTKEYCLIEVFNIHNHHSRETKEVYHTALWYVPWLSVPLMIQAVTEDTIDMLMTNCNKYCSDNRGH